MAPPKVFDLTEDEVRLIIKLSRVNWPLDEGMIEWILDDSSGQCYQGKFNYFLAGLGALMNAELSKRHIDQVLHASNTNEV